MLTKKEIVCLMIILTICILLSVFLYFMKSDNGKALAEISIDGEVYDCVSLDTDNELNISTDFGYNHIIIEDGYIWVLDADCYDHTCVNKGKIHLINDSIICLPHKLCITIIEE